MIAFATPSRKIFLERLLKAAQASDWSRLYGEAVAALTASLPGLSTPTRDTLIHSSARQLAINVEYYLRIHRNDPPDKFLIYLKLVLAAELQAAVMHLVRATAHPQQKIERKTHPELTATGPCRKCKELEGIHLATDPDLWYFHPRCACSWSLL